MTDPRHLLRRLVADLAARVPHRSLGAILWLLERDETVGRALGHAFPHDVAGWLRRRAPVELRGIVELRNPAAHSEVVDRDRCTAVREAVLGIGCEGVLVRVARGKRCDLVQERPSPARAV
jgi:hypothetical protein